jgi:hypothetical protein
MKLSSLELRYLKKIERKEKQHSKERYFFLFVCFLMIGLIIFIFFQMNDSINKYLSRDDIFSKLELISVMHITYIPHV